MDLKQLAGDRLAKLLHDATGVDPSRWSERRGLQRTIKDRLGIDEGMVSKVRRGEMPNVSLEAISKIWMKTGIRPSYFVEPMSPPPIYTDFLTKADPFADLRKQEPGPRKAAPRSSLDASSLRQLAKEIVEIAESRSSPEATISVEARRGSFRSAERGDGLHRARSSRADDDRRRRETPPPPPDGGRSAGAKHKR